MKLLKLRLGIILLSLSLPTLIRAQLVADGQTNILDGVVSNIDQAITIGTNGSFTLLMLTNGSSLSNTTGGVTIGLNTSAQSNRLIISGSQWFSTIGVGKAGSGNELDIVDGGGVDGIVYTGMNSTAYSNLVVVSDPGSILANLSYVGFNGSFNTLIVSNAGQVFSGSGATFQNTYIGAPSGSNNCAIVTGPGSVWDASSSSEFYLGYNGYSNNLLVTDSGTFNAGLIWIGWGDSGRSPLSSYNQLIVSNSGVVSVSNLYVGGLFASGANSVTINDGTVAASSLVWVNPGNTITLNSGLFSPSNLTTFIGSKLIFNGGTLQSGTTTAYGTTNPFVVGNGTNAAVYTMLGGTHRFPSLMISSNAILNGSGTITNNVSINNGGTIAPGTNNLGTIALKGVLTLNPGSTTLMKLDASDSTSDAITGISNLVYGGTLQLTNFSGFYSNGQSFALFAATNYSGAFAALVPASPGPGLRWDTNELSVDGVLRVFSTPIPDTLYVGIWEGSIEQFTPTGVGSTFANFRFTSPEGMAFDASGNMYVTSPEGPIDKITPDGVVHPFPGYFVAPTGLAVDGRGNIYVANAGNNTIYKATPGGVLSVFTNFGGTVNSLGLEGLAFDQAGNLYAAMSRSLPPEIVKITPDGVSSVFTTGVTRPFGLAFDRSGNLYVADAGSDTIEKFTPDGTGTVFASTGTNEPLDLAFDSSGNLFASCYPTTILKFTPDGVSSVFASIPAAAGINAIAIFPGLFKATTAPPIFGSVAAAGGNLLMSASGGIPYDPCYLLTSTNLTVPISDWSSITTNYFDSTGATTFTNAISTDQTQQYFRLQVN
jgi:T5SS/PEP-CTERM-associated repeat protein